jgi:hypothetical protein
LAIEPPTSMGAFSGYYDDSTELLHVIHGHPKSNHYYIEWPKLKRSRDRRLSGWIRLFPTRIPPSEPVHSLVIDL